MFGEINPRAKAKAPFISVEEAIEETRRGHMIIMMDDEQRENEGDLCMAAEKVTPEAINFMAKFGRGLICLPMSAERIDQLGLSMMVGDNQAPLGTAFTASITAKRCSGSGQSAQDRSITILQATREDASIPGAGSHCGLGTPRSKDLCFSRRRKHVADGAVGWNAQDVMTVPEAKEDKAPGGLWMLRWICQGFLHGSLKRQFADARLRG